MGSYHQYCGSNVDNSTAHRSCMRRERERAIRVKGTRGRHEYRGMVARWAHIKKPKGKLHDTATTVRILEPSTNHPMATALLFQNLSFLSQKLLPLCGVLKAPSPVNNLYRLDIPQRRGLLKVYSLVCISCTKRQFLVTWSSLSLCQCISFGALPCTTLSKALQPQDKLFLSPVAIPAGAAIPLAQQIMDVNTSRHFPFLCSISIYPREASFPLPTARRLSFSTPTKHSSCSHCT